MMKYTLMSFYTISYSMKADNGDHDGAVGMSAQTIMYRYL